MPNFCRVYILLEVATDHGFLLSERYWNHLSLLKSSGQGLNSLSDSICCDWNIHNPVSYAWHTGRWKLDHLNEVYSWSNQNIFNFSQFKAIWIVVHLKWIFWTFLVYISKQFPACAQAVVCVSTPRMQLYTCSGYLSVLVYILDLFTKWASFRSSLKMRDRGF